jgi:hypothetical protein
MQCGVMTWMIGLLPMGLLATIILGVRLYQRKEELKNYRDMLWACQHLISETKSLPPQNWQTLKDALKRR